MDIISSMPTAFHERCLNSRKYMNTIFADIADDIKPWILSDDGIYVNIFPLTILCLIIEDESNRFISLSLVGPRETP